MKTANRMIFALAAVALLASWAGADGPWAGVSAEAPLDTRSLGAAVVAEDQDLDTRTHTVEWSAGRRLNTKKIVGTMLLLR